MNLTMSRQGFTLVEMLIAVAVSLIALIAVASMFIVQNRHFVQQFRTVEMQQSVRAGIQIMERELLLAGLIAEDPGNEPTEDVNGQPNEYIVEADTDTLAFEANIDADVNTETIRYTWSGTAGDPVTREVWEWDAGAWGLSAGAENIAENVENLSFSYFRFGNTPMSAPLSTASDRADVRRIGIELTVRSQSSEPETMTLESSVTPRNLAVGP